MTFCFWHSMALFVLANSSLLYQDIYAQTVIDRDGNKYSVFSAGNYHWMSENLKVEHDPDGHPIDFYRIINPYMDTTHYGLLYSWETAMDSSSIPGSRGICPDGWHIPTDSEWDSLVEWAGGITIAGTVLKSQGIDSFGVQMAGNYNFLLKDFYSFGENAYFWTSDSYSVTASWMRHFGLSLKNINRSTVAKHYGFSIRCVRRND